MSSRQVLLRDVRFSTISNHAIRRKRLLAPLFRGETWFSSTFAVYRHARFINVRAFSTVTKNDGSNTSNNNGSKNKAVFVKDKLEIRIARTLLDFLWPKISEKDNKEAIEAAKLRKKRVIGSLGLMMGGKAVTIQVPYIFKHLVDSLPASEQIAAQIASSDPATAAGVPILLLLGYGTARASASGLQELRNAVFAHVAQDIIRKVGRRTFDHVHQMDMQFHLERNTGQLSRILDRGNRSITFVLNAMIFHVGKFSVTGG